MTETSPMQRFIEIYKSKITREGADKLLEYLTSPSCDFFTAPASTRYHGSYPGGLLEHSLNVYDCLCDYLARPRVKEIYGELDVKISGSGDLTCAGELDKLVFVAGGSGDLKGKNLTVKDAELHTTGASSISIGRITGCSREMFSKSTSVKIGKRG